VQHGPDVPPSREALFRFHAAFHVAFPDGKFIVDDMIGEDDKVLIRWTMCGTQTGPWFNVPATGRKVNFVGMDLWRYADSQLVEAWFVGDNLTLMKQLGILKGF
jgi:predicted ester cyclase